MRVLCRRSEWLVVLALAATEPFGAPVWTGEAVVLVVATVGLWVTTIHFATLVYSTRHTVARRYQSKIIEALAATRPDYLVYFSAPDETALYQIRQWLPHLHSFDRRFAVVVREKALLAPVAAAARPTPVVWCGSLALLNSLVGTSVRAAVYVNNGMKNAHLIRHTGLRHIQLLHGESDKAPSTNKLIRAYDDIYVAGRAAIDRYEQNGVRVDPEAFHVIGRPQADGIRTGSPSGRPTVLYAPTWEGWQLARPDTSLGLLGVALVGRLLERGDVRVVVRPHPSTGLVDPSLRAETQRLRAMVEAAGGDHVWSTSDGPLSLVDCFNLCRVLVTDISSVLADFLHSEKPLVVTDVDRVGAELLRRKYPTVRGAAVLAPDAANLDRILDDALSTDSLRADRLATCRYVLGDFRGSAEARFHAALARSIGISPGRGVAPGPSPARERLNPMLIRLPQAFAEAAETEPVPAEIGA